MKFLRRILDAQLRLADKGKPFEKLKPMFTALDTFFFEFSERTRTRPHVRDAVDLKRWMVLVVVALIPCIAAAIWNTGTQKLVYGSHSLSLFQEFQKSCHSLSDYISFFVVDNRWQTVLLYGLQAFLPVMIISYAAGGLCEAIFACWRGHEIAEGFLVSGILFALILPPTIPYWMVALGVIVGIVISKELFGGTGMNIVNPAMFCRIFLFFSFPAQMSGDVWVGTNPVEIRQSVLEMNAQGNLKGVDGISQATNLARMNVGLEVKRIHADAIESYLSPSHFQDSVYRSVIQEKLSSWLQRPENIMDSKEHHTITFHNLDREAFRRFVTDPLSKGGLGLASEKFEDTWRFAELEKGHGTMTNWNFFLGNKLGSFGETSTLACMLGAMFLLWTGIASWRTMAGVLVGVLGTSLLFAGVALAVGSDMGAWTPAVFSFPSYKHFLIGGLAFGLVFMATDPVSSPGLPLSRWIFGMMIGAITILIRYINPAYPEGVMLATITANVTAPLIDHYVARRARRVRRLKRA